MKNSIFVILVLFTATCSSGGQNISTPVTKVIPKGVLPQQTSTDPTYGYSIKNPIKVGGPKGFSGPASSRLYLRHLFDSKFRPFSFKRLGSRHGSPDTHITDLYELTDKDGKKLQIYVDMYHPEVHPFHVKAPKGLYFWK